MPTPAVMPDLLYALCRRWRDRYPLPQKGGSESQATYEDRCRIWTYQLAQQATYDFPMAGYGVKRAGAGRPLSKDFLPQQTAGRLIGWDVMVGAGTGKPTFPPRPPTTQDITGQVWEAVPADDRLGPAPPDPPDPPDPPEPPTPPTPGPPMPPRPWISYDQTLGEVPAIVAAYAEAHGVNPAYTDLAHNLYRRLCEYDRWPTLAAVLRDI